MADARTRIAEGLQKAIEAERIGYNFYLMAAQSTEDARGRAVFTELAAEEREHERALRAHHAAVRDTGRLDPNVRIAQAPFVFPADSPIFSPELRQRAATAHFEMTALAVAIQLELSARTFYANEAAATTDPAVKAFFTELAEWESGHYAALLRQQEELREDYWADGGFAPS